MSERSLMLMGEFFDHVSETYDDVHSSHIDRAQEYYAALSDPVAATTLPVTILGIGCGSGLELEGLFGKIRAGQMSAAAAIGQVRPAVEALLVNEP
jgi:hypothetical protein